MVNWVNTGVLQNDTDIKIEVYGGKSVPHGLTWDRTRSSSAWETVTHRLSRWTAELMLTSARESNPDRFGEEAKDIPHIFADSVDSSVSEGPAASIIRIQE